MVSAREIVNGTVSLLGIQGKIKNVKFNAPDGDREGILFKVWEGDNIIVQSWPVGSGRRGNAALYQMQCSKYAMGGNFPPNTFYSPCTMLPVKYHDKPGRSTFSMAPGGSITEGTIIFTLQASPQEANTHFGILAVAVGAMFFLL